jgi:LysM repeat protein
MTKKLAFVLALSLVFVLVLSGCERSASQNVLPTPTLVGELSLSDSDTPAAEEVMAELQTFATQTAMAESGVVEATSTPTATPGSPLPAGTETVDLPTTTSTVIVEVPNTPGPTPVITRPATYTLMKGEFPFCIARRFNLNQYELLNLNGLTLAQGNYLPVGYTLKIPQTGNPFVGERGLRAHPATYTVTGDETIYKVACIYGDVAPESIIAVNNLAAPYTLTVGQQLSIP